jgi:ubiquinone/menaquinone biosynthesis C-methylase UbiE
MEILILASVKRASGWSKLPDYARMMSAYHRAFARELQEIVGSLPVHRGDRVVDFACGDGSYSRWLARQVGREGKVVALDISPAFLDLAQRKSQATATSRKVQFVQGDLRHLPLAPDRFDLVWCAQSLYSLPDPVDALRRMSRAVRAGGHVSVLENDEFHHVLLPWPVELELALKKAELQSFKEQSDRPRNFYVGRDLRRAFRAAGLVKCQARSIAFSRGAPLDRASRAFFASYLEDLRRRVGPHLEPEMRGRFERLVVPGSDQYLLSSPDLTVTCVNQVMTGVKPNQTTKQAPQRAR